MATKKNQQQYTVMRTFVVTYEIRFGADTFEKAVEIAKVLKPEQFDGICDWENTPTRLCVFEE